MQAPFPQPIIPYEMATNALKFHETHRSEPACKLNLPNYRGYRCWPLPSRETVVAWIGHRSVDSNQSPRQNPDKLDYSTKFEALFRTNACKTIILFTQTKQNQHHPGPHRIPASLHNLQ